MPASARWSSSATPIVQSARRRVAQPAMRLGGIEVGREQVRAEPRQRRVEALGPRLEQLDDRGVEADRDRAIDLEHEPGPAGRPAPALAGPVAVPRAVHPQVGPELEPAVEPDQQVLALRLDRVDALADDPLDLRHGPGTLGAGGHARPARRGTAGGRRRSGRACRLRASGRLARATGRRGGSGRGSRRLNPASRSRSRNGDSPTGRPSTLRMTSSRVRPVATSVARPRSAAAATAGSSAAGSVWSVDAAAFQVERRDAVDEHDVGAGRALERPPVGLAAARPRQGGAVRVGRIGRGQHVDGRPRPAGRPARAPRAVDRARRPARTAPRRARRRSSRAGSGPPPRALEGPGRRRRTRPRRLRRRRPRGSARRAAPAGRAPGRGAVPWRSASVDRLDERPAAGRLRRPERGQPARARMPRARCRRSAASSAGPAAARTCRW